VSYFKWVNNHKLSDANPYPISNLTHIDSNPITIFIACRLQHQQHTRPQQQQPAPAAAAIAAADCQWQQHRQQQQQQ